MSNFAQKLGWPDSATFVPALSSVADTTEDIIKRVVSKELANLGGEGGSGSIEEARVRAIANYRRSAGGCPRYPRADPRRVCRGSRPTHPSGSPGTTRTHPRRVRG